MRGRGRLLVLDNQLVVTLRDGRREVFQLSDNRDGWLRVLTPLLAAQKSAYR